MARKAQREWTQVSGLVGRIGFDVSGGKEGDESYIPPTKGFVIEVRYDNEADKMYAALCNTAVAVQNVVRTFYRKNKRFPFKPGQLQKVTGDGDFTLPATVHMDRLEAQAASGEFDQADIERLQAILSKATALLNARDQGLGSKNESSDTWEPEMRYDAAELQDASVTHLRLLAVKEGIDDHATMKKDELVRVLSAVLA